MTIAAGFNFTGGILLGADKKQSARMKLSASKIFHKTYNDGSKSVIVIAGSVMYARMGMQSIEAMIEAIPNRKRTTEAMVARVTEAVRLLHHNFLFKHPETPEVQYVIGLWSPSGGLKLITTEDTAVNEMRGYDCVGAGAYLAHYLVRSLYQESDRNFPDVLTIAVNAFARIRAYDNDCGGDSEFITLLADGKMSPVDSFDISKIEIYSDEFDDAASQLFIHLYRPSTTIESTDEELKKFSNLLRIAIHDLKNTEALVRFGEKLGPPPKDIAERIKTFAGKKRRMKAKKELLD